MGRDIKPILISTMLMALAILLQSTLLHWVALKGVKPDLALVVLVYVAIRKGSMVGQVSGFAAGIVEDVLSLSPLGYHALFRTVLGFFYGLTVGNIFIDPVLMPVILLIIATVIKGLLSSLVVLLFAIPAVGFFRFAGSFWIELGYNALLAPFLFAVLGLIKPLRSREREE